MRNLTICASVALILLLLSPMLSGGSGNAAVAGVPSVASAGTRTASAPASVIGDAPAAEACFRRYRREAARCRKDDGICYLRNADRWDVCEATGFWP